MLLLVSMKLSQLATEHTAGADKCWESNPEIRGAAISNVQAQKPSQQSHSPLTIPATRPQKCNNMHNTNPHSTNLHTNSHLKNLSSRLNANHVRHLTILQCLCHSHMPIVFYYKRGELPQFKQGLLNLRSHNTTIQTLSVNFIQMFQAIQLISASH